MAAKTVLQFMPSLFPLDFNTHSSIFKEQLQLQLLLANLGNTELAAKPSCQLTINLFVPGNQGPGTGF